MLGRHDVVLHVMPEACAPARANTRLRGKVEDDVRVHHQIFQLTARQVDGREFELVPILRLMTEVAQLWRALVVVIEAIDTDNTGATPQQRLREVRADKAGAPRDKRSHHRVPRALMYPQNASRA